MLNNNKDIIFERLTMLDVLQFYTPRNIVKNRCPCPLHDGKDNNFNIYDTSFYCWVCHQGGDLIKFVSVLFGITYSDAIGRIDLDFSLGLFEKPTLSQYRKQQKQIQQKAKEREEQSEKRAYSNFAYKQLCRYYRWIREQNQTEAILFDLNYIERLLDMFLPVDNLITFDVNARIFSIALKHMSIEEAEDFVSTGG